MRLTHIYLPMIYETDLHMGYCHAATTTTTTPITTILRCEYII